MTLVSYLAFLVVLEGAAFLVAVLIGTARPLRWGFVALCAASMVHAGLWVVALGADEGALASAARAWDWAGVVIVGLAAAVLAVRMAHRIAWGTLAGWAALVGLLPWLATGLLLAVFFSLVHRPGRLELWQRTLPQTVPDAVVFLDKEHRVIGANPVAQSEYPVLAETAAGRDLFEFFDDSAELSTAWARAEARVDLGPLPSLSLAGVPAALALVPRYDRFGDFVGAVAFLSKPHPGEAETRWAALSPREREVVELVVQGHSNREIAERLFLSEGTVKRHLHQILGKMHVARREELRILQAGGTK